MLPSEPSSRRRLAAPDRSGIVVEVEPASGGRVAQISIGGTPILVDRTDVPEQLFRDRPGDGGREPAPTAWGSYPMVPWAGRVRRGRFEFRGSSYQLPINFGDHAIHGVGFEVAWTTVAGDDADVVMELELPADERWPFGGRAEQRISVGPSHVLMEMEVEATDRSFPVSFGWHPWFRKPESIRFAPESMYRRDADGIAVADLVPVPDGPWDDCFVNRSAVRLRIGDRSLSLTSDCHDWVVYDEPAHATCVEPQTGPPDAFTIAPRILEPGDRHRAWYRIDVDDPPAV